MENIENTNLSKIKMIKGHMNSWSPRYHEEGLHRYEIGHLHYIMASSLLLLWDSLMCKRENFYFLCLLLCSFPFFCLMLTCYFCCVISITLNYFIYYSLEGCLFSYEKQKKRVSGWSEGGVFQERVGGEKTIIIIYFGRKN